LVILEIESWELFARTDLEPWSSPSQPPRKLGLQEWPTGTQLWLAPLKSLMFSRFTHAVTFLSTSFLFHCQIMPHCREIHLSLCPVRDIYIVPTLGLSWILLL
jgi:hypothetical protein